MAFPADVVPYSYTGTFEPYDVAADEAGRTQLILQLCAPFGNYELEIVIHGDFAPVEGQNIAWEIEDGKTEVNRYISFVLVSYSKKATRPFFSVYSVF